MSLENINVFFILFCYKLLIILCIFLFCFVSISTSIIYVICVHLLRHSLSLVDYDDCEEEHHFVADIATLLATLVRSVPPPDCVVKGADVGNGGLELFGIGVEVVKNELNRFAFGDCCCCCVPLPAADDGDDNVFVILLVLLEFTCCCPPLVDVVDVVAVDESLLVIIGKFFVRFISNSCNFFHNSSRSRSRFFSLGKEIFKF